MQIDLKFLKLVLEDFADAHDERRKLLPGTYRASGTIADLRALIAEHEAAPPAPVKSDERFRWIRFNTLHAHGPGPTQYREIDVTEWTDTEVPWDQRLDIQVIEVAIAESLDSELSTGSDKWRGVEVEFVTHPPLEWLRNAVRYAKSGLAAKLGKFERMAALLKELEAAS